MKRIIVVVLAMVMLFAFASTAYAWTSTGTATWSSTKLSTYFNTTDSISKPAGTQFQYNWVTCEVWQCEFNDGTDASIGVYPVNTSNQIVGYGSGTSDPRTLALVLYDNPPNTIKLRIENHEGGVNIKTSGDWYSSYQ